MAYLRIAVLGLAIALSTTACEKKRESGAESASTLRVHLSGEPVSLDPALAEDGLSLKVLGNLLDGLVGYDGAGKLQNRLAESVAVSPDGKRYEFRLRKEARWSDGKPVQISEFVTGFRRSLAPQTSGRLAELLMPIRGAKEFHSGSSNVLGSVREENGKLVIELEKKAPYFLQVLALSAATPHRQDAPGLVTGPYRMASHEPDRKIVLERNANYWGKAPRIARVELVIVRDESTAVNLFDRAKLDIVTRVPTLDYPRLRNEGVLHTDPFHATYFISFNTRKPPFDDPEWRRAVAASIRRKEIADVVATGEAPARSWIPRGIEGYIPYESRDSVTARDEAAISKVKTALVARPASFEAGFDSSGRNATIMEKVQRDVAANLGLKISLSQSDWKSYVKLIQSDPPAIFRFGWLAPFHDPIPHLQAYTSGNPNNHSGWGDPRYDRLVEEIGSMDPGPEREKKTLEAQRILLDEAVALVPIYHYSQVHAVKPRVSGFRVNPFGVIRFEELELRN